jgi:hypothetical protein
MASIEYLNKNNSVELFNDQSKYFGWYKEYFAKSGSKIIGLGYIQVDAPDRPYVGYEGRVYEPVDPRLKKAKKVRSDDEVYSILYPLCK